MILSQDLRLQRQTKFVEPLIAWRPDGQDLSAHDLLVGKDDLLFVVCSFIFAKQISPHGCRLGALPRGVCTSRV